MALRDESAEQIQRLPLAAAHFRAGVDVEREQC
jgi:hypothetical protein